MPVRCRRHGFLTHKSSRVPGHFLLESEDITTFNDNECVTYSVWIILRALPNIIILSAIPKNKIFLLIFFNNGMGP